MREREPRAIGDFDLQFYQVEASGQFGYGMFHLQARVHLKKVEAAAGVHQKLYRAGVVITSSARGFDRRFAHGAAQVRMRRHQRRGTLFDHLLMAPLDGTLALAQVDHVAVAVAQHLNLYVARALD